MCSSDHAFCLRTTAAISNRSAMETFSLPTPPRRRIVDSSNNTAPSSPARSHMLHPSEREANFYSVPGSPANHLQLSLSSGQPVNHTGFFNFTTTSGGGGGYDDEFQPLKLPPRLLSPYNTPPRPLGGGSTPKRSPFNFKTRTDFDPFAAAVEQIRKEEDEVVYSSQGKGGRHRRARSIDLLAAFGRGKKSGKVGSSIEDGEGGDGGAFEFRNGLARPTESNCDSRLATIEERGSRSTARYKQSLLACFGFKS